MQNSVAKRRLLAPTRNSGLPNQRDALTVSLLCNILLALTLMFLWANQSLSGNRNDNSTALLDSTTRGAVRLHGDVQEWHGGHPVRSKLKGSCWCNDASYCMCSPNVAIDLLILSGTDHIWLARRKDSGQYAIFGGFVHVGESTEEAVYREVYEETRIDLKNIERSGAKIKLLGVYSDPRRDSRRHTVSVIYSIHLGEMESPVANDDVKAVERVRLSDIGAKNLFSDHKTAVLDYIAGMRDEKPVETIQRLSPGDFAGDIQRSICPS